MGRLTNIEKLVNKATPHWAPVKLMPRGVPTFLDPLLRGNVRFARKTGATLSVLNPDVTTKLAVDVQKGSREIIVTRWLQWFELNSLLTLGPNLETVVVEDLDLENNKIILKDGLKADHTTREFVEILAVPIYSNIDHASGVTSINIRARYNMVNGDVLLALKTDSLESQLEFEVDTAQFGGIGGDPEFPNIYQLNLKSETFKAFAADEMLYVRAFPAYVSQSILLQERLSSRPIDPHLLDYLSGKLKEGKTPTEIFSLKIFDKFDNPLLGDANTFSNVSKNYPIFNRNIAYDAMVFWDLVAGKFQLSPTETIAISDENGLFNAKIDVIPSVPAGVKWRVPIKVESDSVVRFRFIPNDWQEFTVTTNKVVIIGTELTDQPFTGIELAIKTNPNLPVRFSAWTYEGAISNSIQYSLLAKITGVASWQGSGIIAKPYFLTTNYIGGRYDSGEYYDSGRLRL